MPLATIYLALRAATVAMLLLAASLFRDFRISTAGRLAIALTLGLAMHAAISAVGVAPAVSIRHAPLIAVSTGTVQASLGAAFEPVNRMKFMETDMASFAEAAPLEAMPGRTWNYHDGNYVILSKLMLDATGGKPVALHAKNCSARLACAMSRLSSTAPARRKDGARCSPPRATGPASACSISATAWSGENASCPRAGRAIRPRRRLTPLSAMARASGPTAATAWAPTIASENGWPRDAFFAKGSIGRYVIVIASQRLVIARFGRTVNWPLGADGVAQLVSDVMAATNGNARLAGSN